MEAMQDGSETKWWTDGVNVNWHEHEMDVEQSDEKKHEYNQQTDPNQLN